MSVSIFDVLKTMTERGMAVKVSGESQIAEVNFDPKKNTAWITIYVDPEVVQNWLNDKPQIFGVVTTNFAQFKQVEKELEGRVQ